MILFDRTKSLASIRTRFAIADGGAGWEVFSIFGASTNASIANLANYPNGVPNTIGGSPSIGSAGMTVNFSNYLQCEVPPDAGSETLYLAIDPGASPAGGGVNLLESYTGNYNTSFAVSAGGIGFGINAYAGFTDSSGNGQNVSCSLNNSIDGSNGNKTFAGPQFYAVRVDMGNMQISIRNYTRTDQSGTASIPAGYTKVQYGPKYRIGGYESRPMSAVAYAFGKRSGASTDAQDLLIYRQFKANLAAIGITI